MYRFFRHSIPLSFDVRILYQITKLFLNTHLEYGMNQLKEAAIDGRERYVVDESTRYCSPKRRTAITRPAWKALKSYAPELPEATILFTTTTRTDDIIESVILIDGPSTALRCQAMGGSVLYVCLYVYTCTVSTVVSP
jgi:hypothetical protein